MLRLDLPLQKGVADEFGSTMPGFMLVLRPARISPFCAWPMKVRETAPTTATNNARLMGSLREVLETTDGKSGAFAASRRPADYVPEAGADVNTS